MKTLLDNTLLALSISPHSVEFGDFMKTMSCTEKISDFIIISTHSLFIICVSNQECALEIVQELTIEAIVFSHAMPNMDARLFIPRFKEQTESRVDTKIAIHASDVEASLKLFLLEQSVFHLTMNNVARLKSFFLGDPCQRTISVGHAFEKSP